MAKKVNKNTLTAEGIQEAIETLKGSERLTKATLSQLSRDLLNFVTQSERIELVNSTLMVLTPLNRATAELFFKHFLPWAFDGDKRVFTTRFDAGKKSERKHADMVEFLADPGSDIWTWADRNIAPPEFKVPDFKGKIASAIDTAMKGKLNPETKQYEGALTKGDVFLAILSADGMTADDIVSAIAEIEADNTERMESLATAVEEAELEPAE